jgi:hypothetical protein
MKYIFPVNFLLEFQISIIPFTMTGEKISMRFTPQGSYVRKLTARSLTSRFLIDLDLIQ